MCVLRKGIMKEKIIIIIVDCKAYINIKKFTKKFADID